MIATRDLETNSASCAWFAGRDAERRSAEASSTYSWKERSAAQTVADMLDFAYAGKIYITYRKTFISVKIDNPLIKDRALVRELDAEYGERGMIKVITKQGVIYRIMRKKV